MSTLSVVFKIGQDIYLLVQCHFKDSRHAVTQQTIGATYVTMLNGWIDVGIKIIDFGRVGARALFFFTFRDRADALQAEFEKWTENVKEQTTITASELSYWDLVNAAVQSGRVWNYL